MSDDKILRTLTELSEVIEILDKRVSELEKKTRWKSHLSLYPPSKLCGLRFASRKDFGKAAALLFSELHDLPYDLVGELTIIVPREAIPCFEGISFVVEAVVSPADLPPKERRRRKR